MTDVLLVLAIVFPGIWAHVTGRRLCRNRDDAMGAERWLKHQLRGATVVVGSVVCAAALAWRLSMFKLR
jgi:hypothetical protein